eukprot:Opistho-2@15677
MCIEKVQMAEVLQPHFDFLWSPTLPMSPSYPEFPSLFEGAPVVVSAPTVETKRPPQMHMSLQPKGDLIAPLAPWHVNHRHANNVCAPSEIDIGGSFGIVNRDCCCRLFERTYTNEFFRQKHQVYIHSNSGRGGDDDVGVIVVVKSEKGRDSNHVAYRVLVWTAQCAHVFRIAHTVHDDSSKKLSEPALKAAVVTRLKSSCSSLKEASILASVRVRDRRGNVPPEFQRRLAEFEEQQADFAYPKSYKFGVVCVRPGQTTENEIFGNRDSTAAFDEFLSQLGVKVPLAGHSGFAGGLDTRRKSTGDYSVYFDSSAKISREAEGMDRSTALPDELEVMYHVSTLLPFTDKDPQQLQRKRHIGNDVCVIVFMEQGCTTFDPSILRSHFNHVVCAVRHEGYDEGSEAEGLRPTPRYSVQFSAKLGVPNFGIFSGGAPVAFAKGDRLANYLVSMLSEGQRAALLAPAFLSPILRFRSDSLGKIIAEIVSSLSLSEKMNASSNESLESDRGEGSVDDTKHPAARRLSSVPDWVNDKLNTFKLNWRRRTSSSASSASSTTSPGETSTSGDLLCNISDSPLAAVDGVYRDGETSSASSPNVSAVGERRNSRNYKGRPLSAPASRRKSSPAVSLIGQLAMHARRRKSAFSEREDVTETNSRATPPSTLFGDVKETCAESVGEAAPSDDTCTPFCGSACASQPLFATETALASPKMSIFRRADIFRRPLVNSKGKTRETEL